MPADDRIDELVDALADAIAQACGQPDGRIDSMSLTAYAKAIQLLEYYGRAYYSAMIRGEECNYRWPIRVDVDVPDGTVGINQYDESGQLKDRVLISPKQWAAIQAFVRKRR